MKTDGGGGGGTVETHHMYNCPRQAEKILPSFISFLCPKAQRGGVWL
jgi:hypothetical protein